MLHELDRELFLALNFDGGTTLDNLFWFLSGKFSWVVVSVVILWMLYHRYGLKKMLLAFAFVALTVICVDQIANIFKYGTPRLRPTHDPTLQGLIHTVNGYRGGLYGTVSAHAATAFAIATFSIGLIRSRIFAVAIIIWAIAVCYSRIYLAAHFPLDLLFGTIDGVLGALIALKIYHKVATKRYFNS